MNHGSLFSGIGGFDLAAEWMGWENIFHCEINEFGKKVLKYYWPNATSYSDIKTTDFSIHRGRIDILTGGFPCQPYSLAGKRLGKEDDRHLWPEMLRAVREIQPRWIVGENVFGLVNWSGGLVFDEVQTSLEAEGYEVFPFVLPACAVNAPHRRDRIWFVAHAVNGGYSAGRKKESRQNSLQGIGRQTMDTREFNGAGISPITTNTGLFGQALNEQQAAGVEQCGEGNVTNTGSEQFQERAQDSISENRTEDGAGVDNRIKRFSDIETSTNTCNQGFQRSEINGSVRGSGKNGNEQLAGLLPSNFQEFPTQSPLCSRNDGLSGELAGITFSKHRNESIKAYGNAIVPQVVYEIFVAIEQYNKGFLPSSCLADADNQ